MRCKDWKEVRLGDVAEVSSSKRIYAKEYVKSGVPFYRSKEIIEKGKGNDVSTELFIANERYNELKNKFGVPKQGDILLTSVGTLGVPYIVQEEEFYFKDGNLTWIKDFKGYVYDKFIYYWLLSSYGQNQISARSIGSTQRALTINALRGFEIKLPPLNEQRSIAHILSTLDEKIETNNQINKNLEEIAQAIFKHWFVDFEFPNEDGEPYKSSGGEMVESELGMIPKGWEVGELSKIASMKNGVNYSRDQEGYETKIVNVRNFDGSLMINNAKLDTILLSEKQIKDFLLEKLDTVVVRSANPGETLLVFNGENIVYSGFTIRVRATEDLLKIFIFYSIRNAMRILSNSSEGTIFKNLNQQLLGSLKIKIPGLDIVEEFNLLIEPILDSINENTLENGKLTQLRDTLLPKLMSGEIRVPFESEADSQ